MHISVGGKSPAKGEVEIKPRADLSALMQVKGEEAANAFYKELLPAAIE